MSRSLLRRRTPRAFTLIELLVVIAIIAILAAILFPVFAQARESARGVSCLSNTKQLATSQLMYIQDYDETLVSWRNCPTKASGDSATFPASQLCTTADAALPLVWVSTLMPYVKNMNIMFCPSFSAAATAKAMDQADCDGDGTANSGASGYIPPLTTKPNTGGGAGYVSHYGIALPILCDKDHPADCDGTQVHADYDFPGSGWRTDNGVYKFSNRTLASIVEPARCTNIGDGVTVYVTSADRIGTAMGCEARYRHKGESGGNFSFLDGHSKYIIGNSQRYVDKDTDGRYYMRYHTGNK